MSTPLPSFGAGLWHFASYIDRYATEGYAPPVDTLEQIARAGEVGDLSYVDVPYPSPRASRSSRSGRRLPSTARRPSA